MIKSEILNKITKILQGIFENYKDRGLVSVYLWGSIIREDYNPLKSDVDAIGLVNDFIDERDIYVIRKYIKETHPEIKEFHINYLYLSELNGNSIRSPIAKVMHPSYILPDFKNWMYVCGKKFQRSDFLLPDLSFDESIDHDKKRIESGKIELKYLIKACISICYNLHQKAKGPHLFSHKTLLKNAVSGTQDVLPILLEIRENNYSPDLFEKYKENIFHFLQGL